MLFHFSAPLAPNSKLHENLHVNTKSIWASLSQGTHSRKRSVKESTAHSKVYAIMAQVSGFLLEDSNFRRIETKTHLQDTTSHSTLMLMADILTFSVILASTISIFMGITSGITSSSRKSPRLEREDVSSSA